MNLVEKHIISPGSEFFAEAERVSFLSKNLYNYANYIVRQEFIKTSKEKELGKRTFAIYLNYHEIRKMLQGQVDYIALPQKVANHTLRLLDKAWKGFFKSIKDWKRNPSKYLGKPGLPGYLDKVEGRYLVSYEKGAISTKELKTGYVKLSGTKISVPFMNIEEKLVAARIVPTQNTEYILEIIYYVKEEEIKENGIYSGIDLGVNNLMVVTFAEKGVNPIIINGRPVKSINQYYNKKRAALQADLKKSQKKKIAAAEDQKKRREEEKLLKDSNGNPVTKAAEEETIKIQKTSKAIKKLTATRNHKIEDYMHKATTVVVDILAKKGVQTLVIGKNPFWKQECNMGKKANQNFVSIPFTKMIEKLKYKNKLVGIITILNEEAYTSKCSFLDLEEMCHHDKYLGKRTSRGMFISAEGRKINADVNGSYNSIRKVVPGLFNKGIEDFAVNPVKVIIHK